MNPKKHQIVTITFSPCIDKNTTVSAMLPDIKMTCTSPKEEPGGGGINVARAIRNLGGSALAIYFSGGCNGRKFDELMLHENIAALVIPSINETRENIIIVDEFDGKQYRFGMPMTPLIKNEYEQFLSQLKTLDDLAYIIISGSVPPGVPMSIFAEISAISKKKNAKVVVDTKGDALKHAVAAGVFLIKPNLGELSVLTGRKELLADEIKDVARVLIHGGKCQVVVVSMGAEGAMVVTSEFTKQIKPPVVERKSTVGAGDSMVAGIVFSLYNGKSLTEAIQYGVASGTAATLNPGTELCRKDDVENLLQDVEIIDLE